MQVSDPKINIQQDEEGYYRGYVGELPLGMGGQLFKSGVCPSRFGKRETLLASARIAIEKMKKQQQQKHRTYNEHGLAGCVQRNRSKRTGFMVGVYNAEQAGLDQEGGAWVVMCEEHGSVINFPSITKARSWAPCSDEWCEECQEHSPEKVAKRLTLDQVLALYNDSVYAEDPEKAEESVRTLGLVKDGTRMSRSGMKQVRTITSLGRKVKPLVRDRWKERVFGKGEKQCG